MECVIGHKIDYIGVGVVRDQWRRPFSNQSEANSTSIVIFLYNGGYVQARLFAAVYLPALGVCISCCGVSDLC